MTTERKLNEATGELVAGLQYAGNLAVKHKRPFGLMADVDGNWFMVFDTDPTPDDVPPARPNNLPPVDADGVVLNPVDKKWYRKDFETMNTYAGVSISSVPPGGAVRFYPDGHSSSTDNTFVINLTGNQRTVTINGITGRISVQ
jgi:Tfp pilus assembly protein FimT